MQRMNNMTPLKLGSMIIKKEQILSRNKMRGIMAGSGSCPCVIDNSCPSGCKRKQIRPGCHHECSPIKCCIA